MPSELYEFLDKEEARRGASNEGHGTAILNELVKSYGVKIDPVTGSTSWSIDNIKEAFSEQPVWSTIDWLTVGVPVARWGSAAAKVKTGVGAVGKAYKAEKVPFRQAVKATRMAGIPTTKLGRLVSNPVSDDLDEYLRIADDAGVELEFGELRHLGAIKKREFLAESNAVDRFKNDILRDTGRLEEGESKRMAMFLEEGIDPDTVVSKKFLSNENSISVYRRTYAFRNSLHDDSYALGLISKETYERNLKTYNPRLYEEYQRVGFQYPGKSGLARYMPRSGEHPELTRIFDSALSVEEMGKAAQIVAKERLAGNLARSAIAKTPDEVIDFLSNLHDPKLRKAYGVGDDLFKEAGLSARGDPEAKADLLSRLGWKKVSELSHAKEIPKVMHDKWLDPDVAEDINDIFRIADAEVLNSVERAFKSFYSKSMGLFRASKTAYNPATHVRNAFGAMVFHHLTTGSHRGFTSGFAQGIKLYRKGGETYTEALRAGVIGSSFDKEIQDVLKASGITKKGRATALDFMGTGPVREWVQGGAGRAERIYRAIDEVAKLDAFDYLRKKKGMSIEKASLEIHRYTPNFMLHNPIADVVRKHVPFASFSTEAIRVWGNAYTYKPHRAIFWQHMVDTLSYGIGSMNGYSVEDIDEAKQTLPPWQQNKKSLLLPFNVNGKPAFVDMSYLIPLANVAEMEHSNNVFFDLINPSANPFISLTAAAMTEKDPFSGRKIEPRFVERQLGVPVEGEKARYAVGLAEHVANMFTPPLSPNNYSGTNILEMARGQVNPKTGQPLEEGWLRTLAANVTGFRAYTAGARSALQNIQQDEREINTQIDQWKDRYTFAKLNDQEDMASTAEERIVALRDSLDGKGREYFDEYSPKWFDTVRNINRRQLKGLLDRIERVEALGELTPEDVALKKAAHRKWVKARSTRQ